MIKKQAILASIKHWEENRAEELTIDIDTGACAVCMWVRKKAGQLPFGDLDMEPTKCKGNCPLKEMNDDGCCCATYRVCEEMVENVDDYTQEEWKSACQAMIDKLKSLLGDK